MKKHAFPLFLACFTCYSSGSEFPNEIENMTIEGTHIENSLLTPTLKIKRYKIYTLYKDKIERLYKKTFF